MKNKNSWMKWTAAAAAFVLVVASAILIPVLLGGRTSPNSGYTVVALDVNPSLEIEVNEKEEVVEIRALNKDAEIVIGDMNFKKVDLDVAINALIGSMLQNGYLSIDQNSILISIDSNNAQKAESLKESLSASVSAILKNSNIDASIMTQSYHTDNRTDKNDHISAARAALIEKILASGLSDAVGTPYTEEQLSLLKVHDLKQILESKKVNVAGVASSGKANDGNLIGEERALAIAYEKAGVSAADVTEWEIELDIGKKTQTLFYEIEFKAGGFEYEYELIAATGEIVEEEIDAEDDDDDRPVNRPNQGSLADNKYISIEDATSIAYQHAGVTASDVRDMDREFKVLDGVAVYEVDFEVNKQDYDYIIHAETGDILRATVPALNDATATAAEDLALNHAGVARADARSLQTYVEYRNGEKYAYRIEFELRGDMEYEYTVSPAGDEIFESRVDD